MGVVKRKVLAYITCRGHLLVFTHPDFPEAGVQVPAGTLRAGEAPAMGALREAFEETGLVGLEVVAFLGEQVRDMGDYGRDESHHRSFYHLRYDGEVGGRWFHYENDPSDGSGTPIRFELFWVALPDGVPLLIADHGAFLAQLVTVKAP